MTFKQIREGKFSKIIASYLAIQMMIQFTGGNQLFALTGGPAQPEFNKFTPIGTSDMVNLGNGDFNYNMPLMKVGNYPLNLAYSSGPTVDQEASWVGLGWDLSVGQVVRQVRGLPDDFQGDEIRYENDMRDNVTVGTNFGLAGAFAGFEALNASVGLGVQFNNYEGISWNPSLGLGFSLNEDKSTGFNVSVSGSTTGGATVRPSIKISKKGKENSNNQVTTVTGSAGIGFNSRKGLENLSLSVSSKRVEKDVITPTYDGDGNINGIDVNDVTLGGGGFGGGLSFNDQSYTPVKRAGMESRSFTFNGAFGAEFFMVEGQMNISGFGSYQGIRGSEKNKLVPAFGYEHTEKNEGTNGVLDFNREKDREFSHLTTVLPVTNYTYDTYSIQGQGIGGMFRPYRGQVSYLYDTYVYDDGLSGSLGLEFGAGNLVHTGIDIKLSPSGGHTGKWVNKNYAEPNFFEGKDEPLKFGAERTHLRMVGEAEPDSEYHLYKDVLHGEKPFKLEAQGGKYGRKLISNMQIKGAADYPLTGKIKREKRHLRNQSIQKITNSEAIYDAFVERRNESYAKSHHSVGMKVLKPDGSTYVYGKSIYNTTKVEATFDVSKYDGDCKTGLVPYGGDVRGNHIGKSDKYLNRITTPAYAHTYLLSSILSTDYEDVTGDGPTDDDLGSYTQFSYVTKNPSYKWRVPYDLNKASYNEGLKSKPFDQKGNYIYGEKELMYIDKIETKTHIATFELSERKDGFGVDGINGGGSSSTASKMFKLDRIYLFAKPEYQAMIADPAWDGMSETQQKELMKKTAIKVAYFHYNYSQCKNIKNNFGGALTANESSNEGGKLTLEKVYFTYRNSNMGKFAPYEFSYGQYDSNGDGTFDTVVNDDYDIKSYDVWGNYKSNADADTGCGVSAPLTTAEFPFVEQNLDQATRNIINWNLTTINMPSGGKMEVNYEPDDYAYVQDKKAMEMFKVTGAGDGNPSGESDLYDARLYKYPTFEHNRYIYAKVSNETGLGLDQNSFKSKYLADHIDKPIYYRFLLNMTSNSWQHDFVEGFFLIDKTRNISLHEITSGTPDKIGTYAAIPMNMLEKGGGITAGQQVNPIAKSGWNFGRKNLNREVYSLGGDSYNADFESIVLDLMSSLGSIAELFVGPNHRLQEKGCAHKFESGKAWIRLLSPKGKKIGGGLRVAKIKLHDNWDVMSSGNAEAQFYGQEYYYNASGTEDDTTTTSGVATYEPNLSKENPLINPLYGADPSSYAERFSAPREDNYSLKPFGETFYPSPIVTYGKVMVKNLKREDAATGKVVAKNATGKVVHTFYTSKDYPTKSDMTELTKYNDKPNNSLLSALSSMFFANVKNHLTMSQGFSIVTNDMNGKKWKEEAYAEGQETPISSMEYVYAAENKELDNEVLTINDSGVVTTQELGVNYEVVNDFRESFSESTTVGVNFNIATFLVAIFPGIVPFPMPVYSHHENQLRTATTTKVINKHGILKKTIATDLGARVTTENIAHDAHTGRVLLTKTENEYNDVYYSMKYPTHWYEGYSGMDKAAINLDLEGSIYTESVSSSFDPGFFSLTDTSVQEKDFFHLGDELLINNERYWLVQFNSAGTGFRLIDRDGNYLNNCSNISATMNFKVVRSGFRNLQLTDMASVTSMLNPIDIDNNGTLNNLSADTFKFLDANQVNPRIINASAITYKDSWPSQVEDIFSGTQPSGLGVNPFIYNIRGDWRADRSYAYLTGRNSAVTSDDSSSPRREGFFTSFLPYYTIDANGKWGVNSTSTENWTFASQITKFSPYGVELENKDALGRYSSAQYRHEYTLPTAVAANSSYAEMGYEGFEDVTSGVTGHSELHFGFGGNNTISEEEAHTGRRSIKVTRDHNVRMIRSLKECYNDNGYYCPPERPCVVKENTNLSSVNIVNYPFTNTIGVTEVDLVGLPGQKVCFKIFDVLFKEDYGTEQAVLHGTFKLWINDELKSYSATTIPDGGDNLGFIPNNYAQGAVAPVRQIVLDADGRASIKLEVEAPNPRYVHEDETCIKKRRALYVVGLLFDTNDYINIIESGIHRMSNWTTDCNNH